LVAEWLRSSSSVLFPCLISLPLSLQASPAITSDRLLDFE
jgi:hypothetical protein